MNQEELLDNLYNAFDPFEPLPAGDPAYVDCREVRGDEDILTELGRKMPRIRRNTCQLFSGHRGAGKSTELLRLKQYLEENKFFVVYFAIDGLARSPNIFRLRMLRISNQKMLSIQIFYWLARDIY